MKLLELPKRFLVGRPLRSERLGETLLPKKLALPVFCSDPLSSNAYATEEILLMLSLGGLTLLHLTPWIAAVVVALLVVVVASYRQTCHAYPSGGGAYAVSRANLGQNASLVAASALLVDYVLTVAVSVAAGVQNLVSAIPGLGPHAVLVSVGMIAVLALMNLRGVKESGTAFAVPTYGFIAVVLTMIAVGFVRILTGDTPRAESAPYGIEAATHAGGLVVVLLAMRAFASGCTALTGVEAVSNGVPNFKPPKSRNAAATLTIMGAVTIAMFAGITVLALVTDVHVASDGGRITGAPADYEQRTVIAQVAGAVFGGYHSIGFFAVQAFTAAILVLAANTAFNGFPILASLLGHDGFLPRQFARRGDRLVYSNGILILSALACLLIWVFDASTTRLIQLYIIGVFVSFTLSQAGMVVHWTRLLRDPLARATASMHRSRGINALGAVFTAVVLVVVLITKFTHGAWIVVIAMPAIFLLMRGIRRHYDRVDVELTPRPGGVTLPPRVFAIVLVSRLHTPTLRALAYARATRPTSLTAVTVSTDEDASDALLRDWSERDIPVPLKVLHSPYRDVTGPVLSYVKDVRRNSPRDLVAVFIPEYVVGHWWEALLHNQSALRLKARLLFQPGVMVINVPWKLGSAEVLEARRVEPAAAEPSHDKVAGPV
ncbi:APC family permease [Kribbella sp. NPDC026596]|uniref:APC family permease n=1 Tax=Kribbella sp. NPDC026596 TaxID=3155122 RepID=UPI0033E1A628